MTPAELAALSAALGGIVGVGVFVGCTRTELKALHGALFDNDGESKITRLAGQVEGMQRTLNNGLRGDIRTLSGRLNETNGRLDRLEGRMSRDNQ